MKNAAVYIRVSTEDQARDGYSLDAQLKAIKRYAQQNDMIIDPQYIFKDKGISGRKAEKRPAFMEMIKQAKSKDKKFDIILVHKMDRFSRNREDSIVYKSLLKKEYGIPVISVTEPIDPNDKMSVIIEAFQEAMAEYYSINLSEEVKKGQIEKHSKGQLQTRPSFGYEAKNNKLEIVEEEAKIVKLIFEQFAYENKPMMTIAKYINNLGIKPKNGNSFENRTIYFILNNPVYIGKLTYTPGRRKSYTYNPQDPNSLIIEGKHTPIIDIELWNEVQNKLAKNEKWKKPHQHISDDPKHWLKGLIRCKECGCTMVTHNKYKLRCNGYNKGKCSNNYMITIEKASELIINQFKEDLKNRTIKNVVTRKKEKVSFNQYEIIEDKLKELEEQEVRIKEAYRSGIDTLDEYKENKNIIQREKNRLIQELNKIEKPVENNSKKTILENGKKFYEILTNKDISIKEKNQVAHTFINKVEFDPNNKSLELYYN